MYSKTLPHLSLIFINELFLKPSEVISGTYSMSNHTNVLRYVEPKICHRNKQTKIGTLWVKKEPFINYLLKKHKYKTFYKQLETKPMSFCFIWYIGVQDREAGGGAAPPPWSLRFCYIRANLAWYLGNFTVYLSFSGNFVILIRAK